MARAKAIDHPTPWRTRLSRPVRRVKNIALAVLLVCVALIVLGTGWLVVGIMSGTLTLALWQQASLVLGLVLLVILASFAFRVAFFAKVVHRFLR